MDIAHQAEPTLVLHVAAATIAATIPTLPIQHTLLRIPHLAVVELHAEAVAETPSLDGHGKVQASIIHRQKFAC